MHSAETASLNTNGDRASPALTDKAAKAKQKSKFFHTVFFKIITSFEQTLYKYNNIKELVQLYNKKYIFIFNKNKISRGA